MIRLRPLAACTLVWAWAAVLGPLAAAPAAPAPVKVEGRWEPGVYHLGNLIPLVVQVPVPSQAFYLQGDLRDGFEWGGARIAQVRQTPPARFPGTLTVTAQVQVFAVGTVTLPPLSLSVHTADSAQVFLAAPPPISITALLPSGDQPQPPAAAPLPVPSSFPWTWVVAGALALALASWCARWLALRRRRSRLQPRVAPDLKATDPDRWVRQEVERILSGRVAHHERYAALSAVLREYLEIKLGLPFLEWTTSEVHRGARGAAALEGQPTTDLMGILALCDWVVFARYAPEAEEERETAERVNRLLHALSAPPAMEKAS